MVAGDDEIFLNDCWAVYFHDPENHDWSLQSYQRICEVSTVTDWVSIHQGFKDMWQHGMFFVMREHIQPMWEDEANRQGGCLSFKVNKPDAGEYWFQLVAKLLGENLLKRGLENWSKINGVSISPKKNYCILRVWLADHSIKAVEQFHLEAPYYSQIMYKSHSEQNNFTEGG